VLHYRFGKEGEYMENEMAKSLVASNSVLLLIDYQAHKFYGVESHGRTEIKNNVMGLAHGASIMGIPAVLTTMNAGYSGPFMPEIVGMFPGITAFDRKTINVFDETGVREAVKSTGKKQLVISGLWASICMCLAALEATRSGYEVFAVVDSAGSESLDSHNIAIMRMVQAGVVPCTWIQVISEWMGSWENPKAGELYAKVFSRYSGYFGQTESK
jgi:isochorismate hydrolase